MSGKIFCFILFLFPVVIAAQNTVTIHCTFTSAGNDSVIVIPAQYFIDDFEKSYITTLNNGQCDFKFSVEKQAVAQFSYHHQSFPIYIEPGDEMQVNVGNDSLYKAISFAGRGAVHN